MSRPPIPTHALTNLGSAHEVWRTYLLGATFTLYRSGTLYSTASAKSPASVTEAWTFLEKTAPSRFVRTDRAVVVGLDESGKSEVAGDVVLRSRTPSRRSVTAAPSWRAPSNVGAEHAFRAELEEVAGGDDRVMVCVRTPGVAAHRSLGGDDRSYAVLTLRDGRIVGCIRSGRGARGSSRI